MKQAGWFISLALMLLVTGEPYTQLKAEQPNVSVQAKSTQTQRKSILERIIEPFSETYYNIVANGKKLSESKNSAEAEQVAQGARKLFKDGSVQGPLTRFTPESVTKGLEGVLGVGSGSGKEVAQAPSPGKGPPGQPVPVVKDQAKAPEKRLSGADWAKEFPTSRSVEDLNDTFRPKFKGFQKALVDAGASTTIHATVRPPERAYLMHYAWRIAKQNLDASKIPAKDGVNIEWWHGNQAESKKAAQAMVTAFGISTNLKVPPALTSNHIAGNAVDMSVSWSGNLTIKDAEGKEHIITSTPRTHTNPDLIKVAASFGVKHYDPPEKDPGHWSHNGR